jgi:TRAP-type mannitol/chloroaromatic compound transport system permease small subunit
MPRPLRLLLPETSAVPILRAFVRAVDALNEHFGRLVALGILAITALVLMEVVLRYVFAAPTIWGTELITFMFAGYILLGGGYTLLHRDHVNVNILYGRLSPRGRAMLDVLTAGFTLLYCAVLLFYTGWMAIEALAIGRTTGTDWNPPLFPVMVSLPVGAALLLLQALSRFVDDLHLALTGRELAR